MNINISVLVLGILFFIFLIMKIFQNYYARNKKKGSRKRILTTSDVCNVLFNVGLFTAGILSIGFGLGFDVTFLESLGLTQPIINFTAGILFLWFSIRNIFYGGKI